MDNTLSVLINRLEDERLADAPIIPWSCPIPSFGDILSAKVATLGLNPSNREFVGGDGVELDGPSRRFHTLTSLGLVRWSDAATRHLRLVWEACREYFLRNPYDAWFKQLDHLISQTNASYYGALPMKACHLDLIPYATSCKWMELSRHQRATLLEGAGDTLGLLLRDSPIRVLILNGRSVIENFERAANISLDKKAMPDWELPRQAQTSVPGFAYKGVVRYLSDIDLGREVLVLGFNHNIQSSFGVTRQVRDAIRNWIARTAESVLT